MMSPRLLSLRAMLGLYSKRLSQLPAWLALLALAAFSADAWAEMRIVASTSFIQSGAPGRFGIISRSTPLTDGATAFIAELASEGSKEALVINHGGQITLRRAEDFGAVGAPRSTSPFLSLAADGDNALVAVRTGTLQNTVVRIFKVGSDGVPVVVADASTFFNSVGSSARITEMVARDGVIALVVLNAVTRPVAFQSSRIGIFREGIFTAVATSAPPSSFLGFTQPTLRSGSALYFVGSLATSAKLYHWQNETMSALIESGTLVDGSPIAIGSFRASDDSSIALVDNSGARILHWQAGQFATLVRNDSRASDGTTVRFNVSGAPSRILRIDSTHVYFTGVRSVTFPSGSTVDQADVIFRVSRNGGSLETFFDPRRIFSDLPPGAPSEITMTGEPPELTLLVRENMGSQQGIFRGAGPFGPTPFPAVPLGYPQLRLNDRGPGFSYREGTTVQLEAGISTGTTTYAWSLDGVTIPENSDRYTGSRTSRLTLFPFAQKYHRGTYTLAASNSVGTSHATSFVDVQTFDYADGVGKFPPLVNYSVRGFAGSAEGTLTTGISLLPPLLSIGFNPLPFREYQSGTTQQLLVRAIGPGLAPFLGSQNVAMTTQLGLFADNQRIAVNDGAWAAVPNITETSAAVGAFPLAPGSRDSALLISLAQQNYTAQVAAPSGDGTALVEFYVVGGSGNIRNLSARALVGEAEPRTLTIGFVIGSTRDSLTARPVLLRAVGPSLRRFGVSSPATQPVLQLYAGTTLLAENRGYRTSPIPDDIVATGSAYGAFELDANSTDAALLLVLPAGVYTARITAAPGGAGVALAELYTNVGF